MSALLTTGEAMLVLRGTTPGILMPGSQFVTSIAGAEATVAIGVARFGHTASFAGRVGDDDAGDLVRRVLAGEGVNVDHLRTDPSRPTGEMRRYARVWSTSTVTYHRQGSAASLLTPDDVLPAMTSDTRILHITGITQALGDSAAAAVETIIATARERGILVAYDVNHRARLTSAQEAGRRLARILPKIDILFCGEDELHVLQAATDSDHPIQAAGVTEIIIKQSAAGATCHADDGDHHAPAVPVPLVDTVGAGDAFAAGYLSAVLDDLPVPGRLTRATHFAAFTISTPGDWEGLPQPHDLALLSSPQGTTVR